MEPLPADRLRWRCDPASFEFQTTAELDPDTRMARQSAAVEALRFGLATDAPGQNIFVRGLSGTGRMTIVERLLEELRPDCHTKIDRCYVHNFKQPDRPNVISLPGGTARAFRRRVHELAEFIRDDLGEGLESEALKTRKDALQKREQEETAEVTGPFEEDLHEADLALVSVQLGTLSQTAIFPRVNGKPVPPEEYEQLRAQGIVSAEAAESHAQRMESFQKRLVEVMGRVRDIRRRSAQRIRSIIEEAARAILGELARDILADHPGDDVQRFLSQVVDDVAENMLGAAPETLPDPVELYGVNLLSEHAGDDECPIVIEHTPTLFNLLGTIDREWTAKGPAPSDYRMIRAGSLLRADGGYLILDARDVLAEPGAWKVLVRTLRTDLLEIVPAEFHSPWGPPSIKTEPIQLRVKVILIGDAMIYHMLDRYDPDFGDLFKCLADFDSVLDRSEDSTNLYATVLARVAAREELPHFDKTAVAAITEHGARIAARSGKLTARFTRILDIGREAAFLTQQDKREVVTADDVHSAIQRTRARADLPSRRFRELLADGTIQIQVHGDEVGQVNGLAVIQAGPITYGFPARITATIGAGSAGIINIEGQAQLSGAIHTKGFHILGGLMRHLLQTDHPLAFSASVAFEQSYGGIDGDSASGAETCCLLSALTGVPLRQDLAMTGAIDQVGHIQAIGGVNEKIEGFFDTCHDLGLTGTQGVIIPHSNAGDLMLRPDVQAACADGRFRIYAVKTIQEALEIFTGVPAGTRDPRGEYPAGTLLATAVEKALDFWMKSRQSPATLLQAEAPDEPAEDPTEAN
ncbi:MAG: Lon protease family protein [Planctomycetota bacterium]